MTEVTVECSCDPEEIAHAVWHEFHKRSKEPYTLDDPRLDCGYCSRDLFYVRDSKGRVTDEQTEWRKARELRNEARK